MFGTLVESNPRRTRRRGGVVVSAAIHAAAVLLAGWATASAASHREASPPITVHDGLGPVFIAPVLEPTTERAPGPTSAPVVPAPQLPVLPDLPDFGTEIGMPVPSTEPIGEPFRGPLSGSAVRESRSAVRSSLSAPTGIFDNRTADKPAIALEGSGKPVYPSALREAGVEGEVEVEFIIGADGGVRPGSIVVLRSDHSLFLDAVRDVLRRQRFLPAEVRGTAVAVRVRQRFAFVLS